VTATVRAAMRPLSRARWSAVRKLALTVGIITALLAGSSGCSLIGDTLQQKTTTKENLALQRVAAQKFKSNWPQTHIITFTQEGSNNDESGQWATNAIVTIGGKRYQEIVGPRMTGGDPLPDPAPPTPPTPVTVNYSDSTSEVLR
jgi:hypothetical protein